MIARAIAHETDAKFFVISGPEIIHKHYGESEAHLRKIFEQASKQGPSIIFLDEIDAIATKRFDAQTGADREVQRDILEKIESTLRTEFMTNLARTSKRDSHEQMASIFNSFDRQTEGRFMSLLEDKNKDAADKIRSLMFVFEDLSKLDPGGVQTLLRNIDKDKLALALKGANDEMRNLFMSNMSERAAKLMRDDMSAMGPVKLKDVEAAQQEMVVVAKALADRGEIMLAEGGGEEELIY